MPLTIMTEVQYEEHNTCEYLSLQNTFEKTRKQM